MAMCRNQLVAVMEGAKATTGSSPDVADQRLHACGYMSVINVDSIVDSVVQFTELPTRAHIQLRLS